MAVTTTTGSFIRQYNAFTGLSAIERSQSGIARAEVVYYNVNDTWSARPGGNSGIYQTGITDLPKDFGYVLTDCNVLIYRDGADGIYTNATAAMTLYPGGILGPQINLTVPSDGDKQDGTGTTAIGSVTANKYNNIFPFNSEDSALIYSLRHKPTAVLYPFGSQNYTSTPNPATAFNFQVAENVTGQGDYKVSAYIRFLQYDIDQSYNYVIQSPQLTR